MPRVIVYGRESDLNALEGRANVLSYLSGELRKRRHLRIRLKREDLVYCFDDEPDDKIYEKMFGSRQYEEKPETIKKPTVIIFLTEDRTLENFARREKIPFLVMSLDEILENLA